MKRKNDLYTYFGCIECKFRTTSSGCIKFSLTKKQINDGAFIHTKDDDFKMSKEKPCPYAGVDNAQ